MKDGRFLMKEKRDKMIERIEGKVWECLTDSEQAVMLNERYAVSNMKNENQQVIMRIVSDEKPAENAVAVSPDLEDVYLYYFGGTQERA